MLIVLKCGSLKILESSGPVQACNGIALPRYQDKREVLDGWPHFFSDLMVDVSGVFLNIITVRTQFYESQNITTLQLLHV